MKTKQNQIVSESRRDFFIKMTLASLAMTLPPLTLMIPPLTLMSGCKRKTNYQGTGNNPFKLWEELLQAIKTSPDYLPQRVEDLIASKDKKAMYKFVKNEIILVPTVGGSISNNNLPESIRGGINAVLRSGMATPREKVELLNQMYHKAGIESKVVYERTAIKEENVPSFFYRPFQREFAPKISKRQFKKWQEEIGGKTALDADKELIKDYTIEADKLGSKIIKTLANKDDLGLNFNFKWGENITPTVEFVHKEEIKYAHLFDPKTSFGKKHNSLEGEIIKAKSVQENKDKVSIKISYRDIKNPHKEKDLIRGEWSANDLIGNQIHLSFLHGLTLEEQVVTPIGNLRTFTPTLALQAIDKDLEFVEKRSFLADPITIDSKRIPISKKGNVATNGNIIIEKPDPYLQKKVQILNLNATTSGYPMVKLNIEAIDASGNLVEGLSANDFKITDNGKPVRALLENNQRTPKILVLSDASGSMPATYTGANIRAFNKKLKKNIKKIYPAAILTFWKTPSSLFTWLLKASRTDYDLIIYATDGDNDDYFKEENLPIYQSGPPAIILNVRNYEKGYRFETFSKMATVTNGVALNAEDQEKVLEEVTNYVDRMEIPPYVFTYASADKNTPHIVRVSIDKDRLKATAKYTFLSNKTENRSGIAGMYLELKVSNNKPVKRVLAGWDPVLDYYNEPTSKDITEVHQLLLGGVMLAVEGNGPTLAMALSDVLKSKLSNRKWGEAYLKNDLAKAKKEFSNGTIYIPTILLPMMAQLQNQVTEESITYATGYTMCLLKDMPGLNKPSAFTFDYLPTAKQYTMAKDATTSFKININKTAQLAIREATVFQQSTYYQLQKTNLIESQTAAKNKWLENLMDYKQIDSKHRDYSYWKEKVIKEEKGYIKILDQLGKSKSFWKINTTTGELFGIMPDGSGGGMSSSAEQLTKVLTVAKMYAALFATIGRVGPLGGFSLAVVAQYGKTLVKLYAIASQAIILMDTTGMDDKIKQAFAQFACNIVKETIFSLTGKHGDTSGMLDDLIGLIVSDKNNPFSC